MKIAIIGAGAYGTALGGVLSENGHVARYYDPYVSETTLEEALDGAEMVLEVVPSSVIGDVLLQLPKTKPLIVATKGVLSEEVFSGFDRIMILSGPGFADEIKAHKMTYLTVTDKVLAELFKTDYIEFDFTNDLKGVLLCGALKNVYAILAGYLGVLPGDEKYETYITEVTEEMQALLSTNGAEAETVKLYCGVDDLRLTCNVPSRNYQYGADLRKGKSWQPGVTVEGLMALKSIREGTIVVPDGAQKLKQIMEIVWG